MKKILSVFGTRPEAIKMAPVIKELELSDNFKSIVCVTAQHRQMLDQVLNVFKIKPDYDLNIMRDKQNLFDITVEILIRLRRVIEKIKPDLVLTQGDTTTAFTASLAAFYLKIPIGHVEAGLRTYNKYSPFPEEINRRAIDVIADFHFAPTNWAKNNLFKEGISKKKVFVTGNTVVDALYSALDKIESSKMKNGFEKKFDFLKTDKRFILITGHRRESFGKGFENICNAIKKLARKFSEYNFVYPVHLNPNVQGPVSEILGAPGLSNVYLITPLGYLPFVYLMKRAYIILTDSGGIQEEAISFKKPILVMRNTTERPEGIEVGAVRLVGNSEKNIFSAVKGLLENKLEYNKMISKRNPYGDGKAARRIVKILSDKVK